MQNDELGAWTMARFPPFGFEHSSFLGHWWVIGVNWSLEEKMAPCRLCRRDGIRDWLDFGPQALSNRFLRSADEGEFHHPCRIGVCRDCGLMQLGSPVPEAAG